MASLTLKKISKAFRRVQALSRVDLHVADGEFCVLLGPSGCGKSTLLHIVAGLILQDEGTVELDHQPVDPLNPRERDVAMVFQSYALYPHMSVAQNLAFGLRMRKVAAPEIERRIMETARLLGIEDLLERKPSQLSGGQRQRVAMGRAIVRRPRIFLLDEPLSNLDARLRAGLRLELKRLHRQMRSTMVYVTHDQVEAMTLGDQVVVMREGRVHQTGSPKSIYQRPADTFVATFIGSPAMNLFQGTVSRQEGRLSFSGPGLSLELPHVPGEYEGEVVEAGIRPEDMKIVPQARGALRAVVEMISDVGAENYVHARVGGREITVRASKETMPATGEDIFLHVNPFRIHVFHKGLRVKCPVL
ncbi:MAG: sn-glycerol-3-phosphate ABC transporter ATP-binding protein UgpC [Deltaproteobacteria bacterium]|nr:sn-glycerol-3-phosphate ABC transporter ATP-binding protein UgpC [Deltaproteobacteria bacterium]